MLHNFYQHFATDPHFNMAFDEWLLRQALAQPGRASLRFYSWGIETITIGCHQRLEAAVDRERLGATPVIRRVTGGRAVFHDLSEVTYAIALNPHAEPLTTWAKSVSVASGRIASALARFLNWLGLEATPVRRSSPAEARPHYFHTAPCFDSAARYELMVDQRKVVASAQRQLGGVILQHGAIKIGGLAVHPALRQAGGRSDLSLQPVLSERFIELADKFRLILSDELGIAFQSAELTRQAADEVAQITRSLQKNAHSRRNIVERIR